MEIRLARLAADLGFDCLWDVGMMMVFASYGWENCSDARVWEEVGRAPFQRLLVRAG
jgi:hypothetical protein